jgi:hypothetical protein
LSIIANGNCVVYRKKLTLLGKFTGFCPQAAAASYFSENTNQASLMESVEREWDFPRAPSIVGILRRKAEPLKAVIVYELRWGYTAAAANREPNIGSGSVKSLPAVLAPGLRMGGGDPETPRRFESPGQLHTNICK